MKQKIFQNPKLIAFRLLVFYINVSIFLLSINVAMSYSLLDIFNFAFYKLFPHTHPFVTAYTKHHMHPIQNFAISQTRVGDETVTEGNVSHLLPPSISAIQKKKKTSLRISVYSDTSLYGI